MFDYISECVAEDLIVNYGCIRGNEIIVYIKAGLGGDYLGFKNKYLIMAQRLHKQYGCSVISASNPESKNRKIDVDREIILSFIQKENITKPNLYFFGHSNGCLKGLELAASGISFKRMILVNMPLMINFHKTKRWIKEIPDTEIIAIFGEKDPSYAYVPFLDKFANNLKTVRIPGADHNFANRLDEFISFSDKLINLCDKD